MLVKRNQLPSELRDIEHLLKRGIKCWDTHTSHWRSHLQDAYDYIAPNRSAFRYETPGQKKNLTIYDDTAIIEARRYRSKLKALVAPAGREWTQMRFGTDNHELNDDDEQLKALEPNNDLLYRYIGASNADQALDEALIDYTISTGAFTINEGPDDNPLVFEAHFAGTIAIEEGPNGDVEGVWRKPKPYLHMIERKWKGAKITTKMQEAIDAADGEPVEYELLEGLVYSPEAEQFFGVLLDPKEKVLLWAFNYEESSPWIVFRAPKAPGETMGRGVGLDILPTVKVLNRIQEMTLRHNALELLPTYTVRAGQAINPYSSKLGPGRFIPVDSNDDRNPTLRILPRGQHFDLSMFEMTRIETKIKETFMSALRTAEGPVRSATEIAIDDRDLSREEASAFGRLQRELVEAVAKRCAFILAKRGLIDDIRINNRDVTVQHVSPLARAQEMDDVIATQNAIALSNELVGPEVTASRIKLEEVPGHLIRSFGASAKLLRSEEEVEEFEEQARDLIEAQNEAGTDGPTAGDATR